MSFRRLIAVAVLILAAPAAFAAGNVATVDYQRLKHEAPQIQASNDFLKQEFSGQEKAIKQEQARLDGLQKSYRNMGPRTNALKRSSVIEAVKNAQKKLDDMKQNYVTGLALRRRQLRANFTDVTDKKIQAYAKTHGFNLVLRDSVLYGGADTDITDAILAQLKKDYQKVHAATGKSGQQP